eukprot:TRINITY_DN12706_c0_g1_i2.p1 TRINITY_DN12706_c0_g1~~TRINITY_DN12706_c0_g1_i2.p1  ORF type:complete len:219 (-),score=20.58 TRINITY_DN12706_c0_g1_i2:63-719(-)
MTVPGVTMYFTLYEYLLKRWSLPFLAGAVARTLSVFVTSPFEMLRTYRQSKTCSKSMSSVTRYLIKKRGYMGLWTGTWPTLCRDVPFSAIYWTLLEKIKSKATTLTTDAGFQESGHLFFNLTFFAACLSGSISAFLVTPADVIKTRQQMLIDSTSVSGEIAANDRPPLRDVARDLWAREGIQGFFRGVGPRVARIAPSCALMISSYESCKRQINKWIL